MSDYQGLQMGEIDHRSKFRKPSVNFDQNQSERKIIMTLGLFIVVIVLLLLFIYNYQKTTCNNKHEFHQADFEYQHVGITTVQEFNFFIICPNYFLNKEKSIQKYYLKHRICGSNFDIQNHTYVISIKSLSAYNTSESEKDKRLYYCGISRMPNETCNEAKSRCSSPGPMFDLKKDQIIDVVWVNLLDSKNKTPILMEDLSRCYDSSNESSNQDHHCTLKSNDGSLFRTHIYPNTSENENKTMRISFQNWPISTHIHGLQVRPTFDGNPLSWHSNNKNYGIAFQTINNECYYKNFDGGYIPPSKHSKQIIDTYQAKSKKNRYNNKQNPGNLWYHDHAMRSTLYNVANGLVGTYIIRDPKSQQALPKQQFQKIVYLTAQGKNGRSKCQLLQGKYYRNRFYRFKLLQSDFRNGQYIIRFNDNCSDPSSKNINFYIIGADSSLMKTPIVENEARLSSGQRLEILIKFNTTSNQLNQTNICIGVPPIIQPDSSTLPQPSKEFILKFKSQNHSQTQIDKYSDKNWTLPGLTFYNLSTLTGKFKKRMRPLIMYGIPQKFKFTLNGHYMFDKGHSDNPRIGSIEDWYYINTFYHRQGMEGHPMHIHLVNFQVIKNLTLRYINVSAPEALGLSTYVTLYRIAFDMQAIKKSTAQNTDLVVLKNMILKNQLPLDKYGSFINLGWFIFNPNTNKYFSYLDVHEFISDAAYNVNIEDQFDNQGISGINLYEEVKTNHKNDQLYSDIFSSSNCPENTKNKFYCKQTPITKPWYQRWKDTAFVNQLTALVLRIRWASTDYNQKTDKDNYFSVPVDQLIEYPGFISHCHVSVHEDSEMMRPYMLQPPIGWRSKTGPCKSSSWQQKAKCLNKQMQKCDMF